LSYFVRGQTDRQTNKQTNKQTTVKRVPTAPPMAGKVTCWSRCDLYAVGRDVALCVVNWRRFVTLLLALRLPSPVRQTSLTATKSKGLIMYGKNNLNAINLPGK